MINLKILWLSGYPTISGFFLAFVCVVFFPRLFARFFCTNLRLSGNPTIQIFRFSYFLFKKHLSYCNIEEIIHLSTWFGFYCAKWIIQFDRTKWTIQFEFLKWHGHFDRTGSHLDYIGWTIVVLNDKTWYWLALGDF